LDCNLAAFSVFKIIPSSPFQQEVITLSSQKNFRAAANAAPTATPAAKANPSANNIHPQSKPACINLRSTVTTPCQAQILLHYNHFKVFCKDRPKSYTKNPQ
jgi:hypothetical protein